MEHVQPSASTSAPVWGSQVDLSVCDRELIQYCGAVQPHGALLVLEETAYTVLQASANTEAFFGVTASDLLGANVARALGTAQAASLVARLRREKLHGAPVYLGRMTGAQQQDLDAFAHRVNDVLLLEVERLHPAAEPSLRHLYTEVRACLAGLQDGYDLQDILDTAVTRLRQLTGYDRVAAFRFLEDGSGAVLTEARRPDLPSFVGHHFPASDIPEPARRVMALTWGRHTPDLQYEPVPLLPAEHPLTGAPLDLSYALLRSESRMCNRYYQNMGVQSRLILALLKDGALWGLFTCLHDTPRHINHDVRMACESLATMVSLLLGARDEAQHYADALQVKTRLERLVEQMANEPVFPLGLVRHEINLRSCLDASGAAMVLGNGITLLGATPTEAQVQALVRWLATADTNVVATRCLAEQYPDGEALCPVASGVLAARLHSPNDYLLWFRPEVLREVTWAGNPAKPIEVDTTSGALRLGPRRSFEAWKQTVERQARPWQPFEVEAAANLRQAVLVLQRAEDLAQANKDLERTNAELDAFAYIASHDLKEPLRGIRNYSRLLQQQSSTALPAPEQERLNSIVRLTQRMDTLIEALLHYSRLGSGGLALKPTDLNAVLQQVLDTLQDRLAGAGAQVHLAQPLPTVPCDATHVAEILTNLITNAIKYNAHPVKTVEIGWRHETPPVFYVRDNGIGIEARHQQDIFTLFRRLHGREAYGGGTGAGLTIVHKMVERHGGTIWVESAPGQDSTFAFTLAPT